MIAAMRTRHPSLITRSVRCAALAFALLTLTLASSANDDYEAKLAAAVALSAKGKDGAAARALARLTRSHPQRPEAFNNLAVLHARQGRLERARDLLTRAMSTHPSYATAYQNLSGVLAELAARAYAQALDTGSENRAAPQLAMINRAAEPAPGIATVRPVVEPVAEPVVVAAAAPPEPAPTPTATRDTTPTTPPAASPPAPEPAAATPRSSVEPSTVAAAPAAPVPEPVPQPDPRLREVLNTVAAWSGAWSAQDVNRYLGHYDDRFRPAKGLTLPAWRAQRRSRLTAPSFIEVKVLKPSVRFEGDDRARVRFRQRYRSSGLRSTVTKTLTLRKRGSRWLIVEERV